MICWVISSCARALSLCTVHAEGSEACTRQSALPTCRNGFPRSTDESALISCIGTPFSKDDDAHRITQLELRAPSWCFRPSGNLHRCIFPREVRRAQPRRPCRRATDDAPTPHFEVKAAARDLARPVHDTARELHIHAPLRSPSCCWQARHHHAAAQEDQARRQCWLERAVFSGHGLSSCSCRSRSILARAAPGEADVRQGWRAQQPSQEAC